MAATLSKVIRIAVLGIAGATVISPASAEESLRDAIRFGIGFAQLAKEQCPGIAEGPKFNDMMRFLRMGAKAGKTTFDEPKFLAETKQEAAAKLVGKDLCDEARKVAKPDGVIVLK